MATSTSFLTPSSFCSIQCWGKSKRETITRTRSSNYSMRAQQQDQIQDAQQQEQIQEPQQKEQDSGDTPTKKKAKGVQQQPRQPDAKSKNMTVEYGGQWLSSVTRHVRIYAAYIDPITHAFDQTQMDKLTLLLDPSDEFTWTPEACQKVYDYFVELVDHYEGAPLTEYTLRLIGSDIEHYICKLLYDGDIKYNMNARVLNFSMGKPRIKFNSSEIQNLK
ncbi:NAD(P)H-quinone oxidoreductase subunit M, chloroplastic [Dioscorea cayenensis subsp. rotundata]|uniref:NAD(P)H-quinone oxidoreductase subunit M, chloroplastic n=1 Tax=Dioscorea cayennensis subsp. rotundata TaxID=55577 RepID=A0AB40B5Z8_DIOCR|nr:NAD(P)H-quinone oxidoreductase subunit M, chloroplastic [Dioscorea cayenensis subsp. rotundata]XP_039122615.1 NAD(P)H-quinone oxidoreductase subunit M, chloroplastic [Dioscorea cayenensis subsp. rotundata]